MAERFDLGARFERYQQADNQEDGLFRKIKHIHFVGIGGIGMSGIAEVLINLDYKVSGSDLRDNEITRHLCTLGASVCFGHDSDNLKDVDVVVVSSAVKDDNPEVIEARRRLIPVVPRAEMLAELMRLKTGIAVAGTHGKTTTTSIVATILSKAGIDPTVVIGGKLNSIGSNAKLGQSKYLVAEADESDGSFLCLSPTISVVTNIDPEHLDHYGSMKNMMKAYLDFINKVPFYGLAVLCMDNKNIQLIIPKVKKRFVTYGINPQADFQATDIEFTGMKTSFNVNYKGGCLGRIEISMPGLHNVYNTLAAIAVAMEMDLSFKKIRKSLHDFSGIERRFQVKGEKGGIMVVDDYGHHPEEIKATLRAAKNGWGRPVVAVFQPHRYTRTRDLLDEFISAFNEADSLILTDIYPAGETPIEGVSGEMLFSRIESHGHRDVTYVKDMEKLVPSLHENTTDGDIVITLGAGNIWEWGERFLKELKEPEAAVRNQRLKRQSSSVKGVAQPAGCRLKVIKGSEK